MLSFIVAIAVVAGMFAGIPAIQVSAEVVEKVLIEKVLLEDNFQDGDYTSNPSWTVHSGNWSVGADPVEENNYSFNQNDTSEGFISAGDVSWTDYTAVMRFNTRNGGAWVGMLTRFQDTDNYYYFQMQTTNGFAFAKKVNGVNTEIQTKTYPMDRHTWYTLKVVLKGNNIKCYLVDGEEDVLIFDVNDDSLANGKVGVRNRWEQTSMDDVLVTTTSPETPSNITATPTANTVALSWDSVEGAAGYNVYRSTSENGSYTKIHSNTTETSFRDIDREPSTKYFYKVTAIGQGGESPLSAPVVATTSARAENNSQLVCIESTASTVSLGWDEVEGADGYNLYRSTTSGSGYTRIYSGTETSFVDSDVIQGQLYYYTMTYMNHLDESERSNEISIIPADPDGPVIVLDSVEYELYKTRTHATVVTRINEDSSTTDVTQDATFESSNPEIASVDEAGVVTGVNPGTAVITVTYMGKTYHINVTVLDDLVVWYKFDQTEGTTVIDYSGNDNHGALMGGATWLNGKGLEINGTDGYVEMPDRLLNGLTEITINTNIYVDPNNPVPSWPFTFGSAIDPTNDANARYLGLLFESSQYRAMLTTTRWSNEQNTRVYSPFPKGIWKNVTYTQSGTVGTLYVDGVQVAQNNNVAYTPAQMEPTTVNYLGKPAYPQDRYLAGKYKDFRIYNRVLSEDEIKQISDHFNPNPVTSDKAWLDLGDTSAVVDNLVLPSVGEYGSTITWSSSDPEIISDTGVVNRPAHEEGDKTVILTATITSGTESDTKEFMVTVLAQLSDLEKLRLAAQELKVYNIDDVRGNLTLLTEGLEGTSISWTSENTDIITTTGEVTRPAHGSGDVNVKLTATLTLNDYSMTKSFLAVVKEMPPEEELTGYLFTYFAGEHLANGEQIYFALSQGNDPLNYQAPMNGGNPVLVSKLGEKGLRDPFIIRSPEGDKFYLIATDLRIYAGNGWDAAQRHGSRCIAVWESNDLVNWSEQRLVEVSPELAGNTWAPEIFYDHTTGEYIVFWASKIYPDANKTGSPHNRMMYAKTRDFYTFTPAEEYYNPGYSVIDTTMIEHDGKIYRFTKDERSYHPTEAPNGKMVFQDVGDSVLGKFTRIVEGIGKGTISVGEGPTVFKDNNEDKWYLFIDFFSSDGYRPFVTTDLASGIWEPITSGYSFPAPRARHGHVLPLKASEYAALSANMPVEVAKPATEITGITLDQEEVELNKGDQVQLVATITPSNASNPAVLWSSNNEAVATVSDTGIVTAVGAGTATITATTVDGGLIATSDIVVNEEDEEDPELQFDITTTFSLPGLEANKLLDAHVTVKNNGTSNQNVMAIVALYDDSDRMINVSFISKRIDSGKTEKLNAGFKLPSNIEGHKVNVFVWEGTNLSDSTLMPLSDIVTLQ